MKTAVKYKRKSVHIIFLGVQLDMVTEVKIPKSKDKYGLYIET